MRRKEKPSYFVRHWRGQLSLPISYWVNVFLLNALVGLIAMIIPQADPRNYHPVYSMVPVIGIWVSVFMLAAWQVVGTWRSASNHVKRGGRRIWSIITKFVLVLAALNATSLFFTAALPQLNESVLVMSGDRNIPDYNVMLSENGSVIEFRGGMKYGSARKLAEAIELAPNASVLYLDSIGGRIGEALKIKDIVSSRRMDTYVNGKCLSACTISFLGGRERFARSGAKFGFHATSFPGATAADFRGMNQDLVAEAIIAGISQQFAQKAYHVASDDMWFPTADELLNSKFVTRVVIGNEGSSDPLATPSRQEISDMLKREDIFQVMSSADPNAYNSIVDGIFSAAQSGLPESVITDRVRLISKTLIVKYIPRASDQSLYEFYDFLLDALRSIRSSDPATCKNALTAPSRLSDYLESRLSKSHQDRFLEILTALIRTGAANRVRTINESIGEQITGQAIQAMSAGYDDQTIVNFAAIYESPQNVSDVAGCEAIIAFMSSVQGLGITKASYFWRYSMSLSE